jgi:hypothetical protein
MKKLFATAASVIALGFALPVMAQSNTSTVNQIGSGQLADVEQIGTAATNTSVVYQGLNVAGSSGNSADVFQTGTTAIANVSTVIQDGIDNEAVIGQSGDGNGGDTNSSLVTQNGEGNSANVTQGDLVTNNTSVVDQLGDDNDASVTQGGGEGGNLVNFSSIDQDGNGNSATVAQGGAGVVSNTSYITQDGGNTAIVNQH